jgi:leucyl aminopeptidase
MKPGTWESTSVRDISTDSFLVVTTVGMGNVNPPRILVVDYKLTVYIVVMLPMPFLVGGP